MPNALVTSSERQIMEAVIPKLGMTFGATVCAEDVRQSKPAPEPYLLAAELLGVEPAGCVVLEDSPNGVAAAEAAGCLVVAVPSLLPIPTSARPGGGLLAGPDRPGHAAGHDEPVAAPWRHCARAPSPEARPDGAPRRAPDTPGPPDTRRPPPPPARRRCRSAARGCPDASPAPPGGPGPAPLAWRCWAADVRR